ncbi:MAG: Beta-barrel assembly machine subunit BamF [Rhodobacteraceae bacterium HLUCCO18]|nr:MAG: Beta-barrel assembly machine subunit BamF [Rhodobacteraceae bacterium HLUCCO18]
MPRLTISALLGASMLTLVACSSGTPQLMNLRNTEEGPDEFAVLPTAPLEVPENLASLPEPTPGARNRVDPDPEGDAIAALGGNAGRAGGAGANLMNHATRFGVSSDIRPVLAAEDEEFRRRNDGLILERMFGTNVYFEAYRRQALDRYAELERLRRMGVRTPAAPPPAE